MAAIALAEVVVLVWGIQAAVLCDAALVAILLGHFTLKTPRGDPSLVTVALRDPFMRLLPVLALLPLLRILSATMPVQRVAEIYWYAMVGVPLLCAILLTMRLFDLGLADIGLGRRITSTQAAIAWSGIPLGLVAYVLVRPEPLVGPGGVKRIYAGVVILIVFSGFTEEMLFRGLLQPILLRMFGPAGLIATSLLFAAVYLGTKAPAYVVFILGVGLFFGWCVRRTGSLWGVAIAHGIMSVSAILILPLLWS